MKGFHGTFFIINYLNNQQINQDFTFFFFNIFLSKIISFANQANRDYLELNVLKNPTISPISKIWIPQLFFIKWEKDHTKITTFYDYRQ